MRCQTFKTNLRCIVARWRHLIEDVKLGVIAAPSPFFEKRTAPNSTPMTFPSREDVEHYFVMEKTGTGNAAGIRSRSLVNFRMRRGFDRSRLDVDMFDLENCNYNESNFAHFTISFRDSSGAKLVFTLHNFVYTDLRIIRVAFLREIFVEQRGMGYGSQLLQKFIKLCSNAKAEYIVGVFAPEKGKDKALARFYKRCDFKIARWKDSKILLRKNFP